MRLTTLTEFRRRTAELIERARRASTRARFLRGVRQAEADYAPERWTEFEDVEALIRGLKT